MNPSPVISPECQEDDSEVPLDCRARSSQGAANKPSVVYRQENSFKSNKKSKKGSTTLSIRFLQDVLVKAFLSDLYDGIESIYGIYVLRGCVSAA